MTKQVHYVLKSGEQNRIDYVRTASLMGDVLTVEVWNDDQTKSNEIKIVGVTDYYVS